jgi:hypothetical protein
MAYNAIDQRPGPIQASATGVDGSQMPWQDTLRQGEAFVGNLSQRLGQYSGGQLTGPVTFDQGQLMQQANDQLANGSFYNPFSQQNAMQNPDVQRAMGNATQYMQGDFQNPFGPQANVPQPSFNQQSYDPRAQQQEEPIRLAPTVNVPARPDYNAPSAPGEPIRLAPVVNVPPRPASPQRQSPAPAPSAARPIEPPSQGTPYNPQAAVQGMPDVPSAAPPSTPRGSAQANPVAPAAPQRAQIDKINNEINKWERATYGTRQGGGPPAEWRSHIQALKRLRAKAEAGDPAALAWSPKMQVPSANATPTVTMNRRGNAARFGSVRQNGDNLS